MLNLRLGPNLYPCFGKMLPSEPTLGGRQVDICQNPNKKIDLSNFTPNLPRSPWGGGGEFLEKTLGIDRSHAYLSIGGGFVEKQYRGVGEKVSSSEHTNETMNF